MRDLIFPIPLSVQRTSFCGLSTERLQDNFNSHYYGYSSQTFTVHSLQYPGLSRQNIGEISISRTTAAWFLTVEQPQILHSLTRPWECQGQTGKQYKKWKWFDKLRLINSFSILKLSLYGQRVNRVCVVDKVNRVCVVDKVNRVCVVDK